MKDYCDFETKQSLSCVNRRSRDLFRQCQLKDMEHYQFWRTEQRVFDVDLDKLAKCFVTFKKVHQFYSGEVEYSFLYVLYSHNNKIETIDVNLTGHLSASLVRDVELVCGQVMVTRGNALRELMNNKKDLVHTIMSLCREYEKCVPRKGLTCL